MLALNSGAKADMPVGPGWVQFRKSSGFLTAKLLVGLVAIRGISTLINAKDQCGAGEGAPGKRTPKRWIRPGMLLISMSSA